MRIVTLGGGGGHVPALAGLCLLQNKWSDLSITALPATTDSGGASGDMREQLGVGAVGDVAQCVAALHPDPASIAWLLGGKRFGGEGSLRNLAARHCMVLSALQFYGPCQDAMDAIQQTFSLCGRIAPATFGQAHICARLRDGTLLKREGLIYEADLVACGGVEHMWLEPEVEANPAALEAIAAADAIITCPGTLTCSLIPNFLVRGVREAIAASQAVKICIANLVNARKHVPPAWTVTDHAECLEHYMGCKFDTLVCNTELPSTVQAERYAAQGTMMPVPRAGESSLQGRRIIALPLLAYGDVARDPHDALAGNRSIVRHDPEKLGRALEEALSLSAAVRVAAQ